MNIDTFVIALGKESLVRAEGEEEGRFPGLRDLILPLSQQKQREQGDKAALGRRGAVSKQGFELSFHTPGASWGSKAIVVRELLCVGGKTGCSFCGAELTEGPQLDAGSFSVTSPQDTVKERMKLCSFGVLNISSLHGQKTGPTSLRLKTPHTFSEAQQTQPRGRSP